MILRHSCSPLATAAAFCLRAGRPVPVAFLPAHHGFHTTRPLRQEGEPTQDHYEILNLRPDAPLSEIKKSFYALSKTHHPDHNPSDPHAPTRFMRISEAYAVLSHPDRRAAYDRTVPRLQRHHHHPPHRGSYSSTGPAGGRPASGLSRRRGSFTGPPPSFFRSGGWGAHGAKRGDAHRESTGGAGSPDGKTDAPQGGGMGPGQDPFAHSTGSRAANEDVRHFDKGQHERTHRRVTDEARASRRKRMEDEGWVASKGDIAAENGMAGMFLVVSGVLLLGVIAPTMMWKMFTGKGTSKESEGKKRAAGR